MQTRLYLTPADHGRSLSWDEFAGCGFAGGLSIRDDRREGLRVAREQMRPTMLSRSGSRALYPPTPLERPDVLQYVRPAPASSCRTWRRGSRPLSRTSRATPSMRRTLSPDDVDWRDYSPVLVVEVISADTADKDLVRNRRLYLQVPSIKEYWILDPREGVEGLTLLVYRRRGRRWEACRTVAAGATYATPLLPGFSLLLDPLA